MKASALNLSILSFFSASLWGCVPDLSGEWAADFFLSYTSSNEPTVIDWDDYRSWSDGEDETEDTGLMADTGLDLSDIPVYEHEIESAYVYNIELKIGCKDQVSVEFSQNSLYSDNGNYTFDFMVTDKKPLQFSGTLKSNNLTGNSYSSDNKGCNIIEPEGGWAMIGNYSSGHMFFYSVEGIDLIIEDSPDEEVLVGHFYWKIYMSAEGAPRM